MATAKGCQRREHKINYGIDTQERKKIGRPRKTWMERVQAAMTTKNLEPDQCGETGRNGV
jgi:hypothetical protein